jgi:16S rRNA (cytidine1402-2'-O)-methyltransferase
VLVDKCHRNGISVTATPFPNSIALAVALSGFSHASFVFSGFVPVKTDDRSAWMKKEWKRPETLVWMETPYRLVKLLEELAQLEGSRDVFLGMDLSGPDESLLRGSIDLVRKRLGEQQKREFVLVIAPR